MANLTIVKFDYREHTQYRRGCHYPVVIWTTHFAAGPYCYEMKFVCQLQQKAGMWTAEHSGSDIGPVQVTAATREEALRKLEAEIRYWLEMCPCSGQTYQDIDIQLMETSI